WPRRAPRSTGAARGGGRGSARAPWPAPSCPRRPVPRRARACPAGPRGRRRAPWRRRGGSPRRAAPRRRRRRRRVAPAWTAEDRIAPMDSVTALAGLRASVGLPAWLTPNLAGRLFLLDPDDNPQSPYLARLFGVRDLALAAGVTQ